MWTDPSIKPPMDGQGCFGLFNGGLNNHPPKLFREAEVNGEPSKEEVDALIANEMTRLTLKEREKAENDIHGIGDDEEAETPEILDACLEEMETHLNELKHGTAYELAEAMSRGYVSRREFRSMFVRAERYDPLGAAERMLRFFEMKKGLFGHERLVKDIALGDFSEDDMESLEAGGIQLSPRKDSAGRPIVIIMTGLRKYKAIENMQRAAFYIFMASAESEEAQKLGVVAISYTVGSPNFQSIHRDMRKCVPVHIACQHFAYDDPFAYGKATVAIYMLSKRHRVRFRSHMGSHMECQYALSTFGIPRDALPVSPTGQYNLGMHMSWLKQRKEMEQLRSPQPRSRVVPSITTSSVVSTTSSQAIGKTHNGWVDPRPIDILFGRGKTVVEHPGNAWFRDVVDKSMSQYECSTRMEKASIAEMIVDMVKQTGGRFLKPEDDGEIWEEVDDSTARKKVAHTFRNRRKFHNIRPMSPLAF